MFTGIVQGCVKIDSLIHAPGLLTIAFTLPPMYRSQLSLGASIAVNGVCLTVTAFDEVSGRVQFDIIQQTLNVTTLDTLVLGDDVNFERSATMGAEIGGHIISGHIDKTVEVVAIHTAENKQHVTYRFCESDNKYLFDKGFVSLNGCSLTIASINKPACELTVAFIPETLRSTNHGSKVVGDKVNMELDRQTQAIVDTVERVLLERNVS